MADEPDLDVLIIGGGPAGSVLAALLAQGGRRVMVVERDIHPREHVGESLTPSTNLIFERIGFLEKMEDAGFVRKPGACWTAPTSPVGKFVSIRLGEFPMPGARQPYTYNVERDVFDSMLLRHAHESGAKIIQGARVRQVLFDGDRAVGARVDLAEGWSHDVMAKVVVDASGRRSMLATQLGLRRKDEDFNQFAVYSWFRNVVPNPAGCDGMLMLHFLGLERAWAWQIPLRNGIVSVGVVTDKADSRRPGIGKDEYFQSLVDRSLSFRHHMSEAVRIRPWSFEGDYSYASERLTGPGWLMVGDALRFVDPIFSSGVDVAAYSALYAAEAIEAGFAGDPAEAYADYERRVSDGVAAWYELISLFYRLQNLFTLFAVRAEHREEVVRILQGNLYVPETLARARKVIALMEDAYRRVNQSPSSLLSPGALARSGVASTP